MNNSKAQKSTTKRFYLRHSAIPQTLEIGQPYQLSTQEEEIIHQLSKVFRIQPGQNIVLLNNEDIEVRENYEYNLQVTTANKNSITLQLIEKKTLIRPLKHNIQLALCLPNKPNKLEEILEKATELGVNKFYLIKSDLSQYNHQLRLDRLEKIVTEAAEQSEQVSIPRVISQKSLDNFLLQSEKNIFVAMERSKESPSLLDLELDQPTTILIGPEGGFSEREVDLINKHQLNTIKLGDTVLKMDTAALLAIGIISLKLQR